MASMLPPPAPLLYSLRVQLFAPAAYATSDKPIRAFRVPTDPENTIGQFCEEASLRHEGMYGTPFAAKRCQDDQGFDLDQHDVLGSLFANGATIRIVQAHTLPNIRDSVPPTSTLRYEPPSLLGKRDRHPSSPKTNGILPPGSYKPSKRQRITDLHPDHPLPSLEEEPVRNGKRAEVRIIPNSQESIDLGLHTRPLVGARVRPDFLRCVAETPPPPASSPAASSTDTFRNKSFRRRANLDKEIQNSSPASTSEHRKPSAERAAQESAGKASSLSLPQKITKPPTKAPGAVNGFIPSNNFKDQERAKPSPRSNGSRIALAKDDIYDQMPEGDGDAILKAKKAELSRNKRPISGGFNTPPSAQSSSRERSTPGELPLTPNSRKEVQRQKQAAEDATKARLAAAEAAERRRLDAIELQKAEAARKEKELKRMVREEKEQLEAEKNATEVAERERDEMRITQGLAVAERLLSEDGEIHPPKSQSVDKHSSKAKPLQSEHKGLEKRISASPVETRPRKTTSPILPRASSALSSTPFIPTGRKSALKNSPVRKDSSPALPNPSFTGVGIEQNMPLPKRRVSFQGVPESKDTDQDVPKPRLPVTPHPAARNRQAEQATKETPVPSTINAATSTNASKSVTPEADNSMTASRASALKNSATGSVEKTTTTSDGISVTSETSKGKKIIPVANKVTSPQPDTARKVTSDSTSATRSGAIVPEQGKGKSITPDMQSSRAAVGSKPILPNGRSTPQVIVPGAKIRSSTTPVSEPLYKRVMRERGDKGSPVSTPQVQIRAYATSKVKQQSPVPTKHVEQVVESDSSSSEEEGSESESSSESDNQDEKSSSLAIPNDQHIPTEKSIIPKVTATATKSTQLNPSAKLVNEADIETQSNTSSERDSRSPVVYNQQDEKAQSSFPDSQTPAPRAVEEPESEDDSDSSSDEDVEMPDVPPAPSSQLSLGELSTDAQLSGRSEGAKSFVSSDSDTSSSDEDDFPPAPLKSGSASKSHDSKLRVEASGQSTTSKAHLSYTSPSGSADTQDEVDFQLISSLNEAISSSQPASMVSAPTANTVMAKSGLVNGKQSFSSPTPAQKIPAIGFGASLMSMNAKKLAPSSSAPVLGGAKGVNGVSKPGIKFKKTRGSDVDSDESEEDDEEESSDDSDSGSDSSSNLEKGPSQLSTPKPVISRATTANGKLAGKLFDEEAEEGEESTEEESDSESESESGSESDDDESRERRRLQDEIARMSRGQLPTSQPSPLFGRKASINGLKR